MSKGGTSKAAASDAAASNAAASKVEHSMLLEQWQQTFERIADAVGETCRDQEHFTLSLTAEDSQFSRFNRAKVRQTGTVQDGELTLHWLTNQRTSYCTLPFTGDWEMDWPQVKAAIARLRQEISQLPEDPYIVLPTGKTQSHAVHPGELLAPGAAIEALLGPVADLDFAGIYAAGLAVRAQADSSGQRHWFATTSFTLDYSLFADNGAAVKGTYAGRQWDSDAYQATVTRSRQQLQRLAQPPRLVPRGHYRTYLAPSAVAELVVMMSWACLSEASIQEGGSPMEVLRRGDRHLSPLFTLKENFARGLVPQFNAKGEVAPDVLPLIHQGRLVNTLINARTAKEYNLHCNAASDSEDLRAAEIEPGDLAEADILRDLGTGLYLSNLHYLNWSDRPSGRITGMTRYACFWVERGEIVAPIENLRFDESLFNFWGDNLISLTDTAELIPAVDSYEHRSLGGIWTPGMIVEDFRYTL